MPASYNVALTTTVKTRPVQSTKRRGIGGHVRPAAHTIFVHDKTTIGCLFRRVYAVVPVVAMLLDLAHLFIESLLKHT